MKSLMTNSLVNYSRHIFPQFAKWRPIARDLVAKVTTVVIAVHVGVIAVEETGGNKISGTPGAPRERMWNPMKLMRRKKRKPRRSRVPGNTTWIRPSELLKTCSRRRAVNFSKIWEAPYPQFWNNLVIDGIFILMKCYLLIYIYIFKKQV